MRALAWLFAGPRRLAGAQRLGRLAQRPFTRGGVIHDLPGPLPELDPHPRPGAGQPQSFRSRWRRERT